MTLHQLKIFVTVASRVSIAAAAKQLHISQPSVTQQLQQLAREIGTDLHRKAGRGIELTEAGRLFLKEAKLILSRMERLKARLAAEAAERGTPIQLTIGGSYSPSVSLLPSLLARFQKIHPEVQLQLRTDTRLAIEQMILKGKVDLAIINNPPQNHQLTMEFYRSEPLAVFVAPGHSLARKKQLNWDDLSGVGFITRNDIAGSTVGEYFQHLQEHGFKPNVIMQCDTPAAVQEAVRGQMGVGVLYTDVVADNIARGEFKTIELPGNTFLGKSYVIYRKNRPLSACAQEFLNLLHAHRGKEVET